MPRQPSAGSTKLATALRDYREALAHQSATAEVLKIIGAGQAGPQEVFDAIVQRAARLFAPCNVGLTMLEGGLLHLRAMAGPRIAELDREEIASVYPLPNDPEHVLTARVVADGRTLEIPDSAAPGLPALFVRAARVGKFRSAVFVPFGRRGKGVGALVLNHPQPGFRLKPRQLALFETFADQALIAIENARLLAEIREKTRALEVAGRHKSEFLANMSHELRTPLNAVIGFADALRAELVGEVNPKQAEYLGNIREAGEHLLALINDVLDLSKVEAGHMELARSRFDLPGVIAQAMTQVRPRALREEIEFVKTMDPGVGEIEADERKLKQVLLNLLSNAVKFTPKGGRIEVSALLRKTTLEIAVKDSGTGIAPEDQARLFDNFRQLGKPKEGTGLGLALSKRFVELHGGSIEVQSEVGKGATFTVVLPLG